MVWASGGLALTLALSALRPEPVLPADVLREYRKLTGRMDYNRDVRPILADKCFACHGPDAARRKAGLRLDEAAAAYGPLPESPGRVAVKPGRIDRSELMHRVLSSDPGYRMPVPESHLELSATEKAVLARWVEQGAEYRPHWAFQKPVKAAPPDIPGDAGEGLGVIDRFVRARLQAAGMKPAPEADRETLLRRLSLDLTGLPPSLAEIDRFLADTSRQAYERQVDRLLASPHYGERMATDWLDVARFADSHGYTVDRLRDQSPWRDWVIDAFNRNMPYDRFITEQLAGDLMPSPDRGMLTATAFNRNHPQNMEGGIVEEEFQTEYVMDRTNTFGEAFMALSLGCARCHDHKYDPIAQKDYYRLYAFFNNVLEAGQIAWNDDTPTPTLHLPTPVQETAIAYLQDRIRAGERSVDSIRREALRRSESWIEAGGYKALETEAVLTGLKASFPLSGDLVDRVDTARRGVMKHDAGVAGDTARFVVHGGRRVLFLDGDTYLDLSGAGAFRRSDPFTVGIRVWIPKDLQDGVIIHKSNAERLYNFKGFHIAIRQGRFEVLMAHTAPSNAIILHSDAPVPRERWVHLALAYDGSSRAAGLRLVVDGDVREMRVVKDRLTKDIIFHQTPEPGLQVGGWWRGTGFRGGMACDVTAHDRMLTPYELRVLAGVADWRAIARKPAAALDEAERKALAVYRAETGDTALRTSMLALRSLRATLSDTMRRVRDLMVMEEMPEPKPTYLLRRGRYDMPGEPVTPGTPASILGYPSALPVNRYGLAQWLTHPDHPLTARVAVNRLWQQFFGAGLVHTSEDFGNQGEVPSHPELLDWLAVDLRESGWDLKRMVRMIVLSRTYRQDSRADAAAREADPGNRLLARGPSARLTAEMLRDNALAAAGLLRPDIGGRSFRPYQPAGIWDIKSESYRADSSDVLHRRSLYALVRRTVPNPTLSTFDAPDRSVCLSRRQRTNTPLQALVTLNDPTYLEACKSMGSRMAAMPDAAEAVRYAFRSLTGRGPTAAETALLLDLHARQRQRFREQPQKAAGWLKAGIVHSDPSLPADLVAAHAVVASAILNSDATLTKR